MARSVISRRQGDEFQALFFWTQLIKLLVETAPLVKRITFESHQRIFVDDVYVEYSEPILDQTTGQKYQIDAFQCKYHVTQSTTFSLDNLCNSEFLGSEQSMLQRLFDAYQQLMSKDITFRIHVVSSSGWNSTDKFAEFVSPEGHIRLNFYDKGPRSVQGKIRKKLGEYLKLSELELMNFLQTVRFDLGRSRNHLIEILSPQLKLAGLVNFDKTITNTHYAELAWKWLEQDVASFDKSDLEQKVVTEKLIDTNRKQLFVIRHQSLDPIAPDAIRTHIPLPLRRLPSWEYSVDLTASFRGGRLVDTEAAIKLQISMIQEIKEIITTETNIDVIYYGIAHIPLVFLCGQQLIIRKPIYLFDHNRSTDTWDLLAQRENSTYPELLTRQFIKDNLAESHEAVIKFGVSYPILDADILQVIPNSLLTYEINLPTHKPDAIRSHKQLEDYVQVFRKVLDLIHNTQPQVERIHLFYAGPVSLAFRCGQLISPTLHPRVFVYNYVSTDTPKYKWGICVNISTDSLEFFVRL